MSPNTPPSLRPLSETPPVVDPVSLKPNIGPCWQLYVDATQSDKNPNGYNDGFIMSFATPRNGLTYDQIGEMWQEYRGRVSPREFFDMHMELGSNTYVDVPDAEPGMPIENYMDFMATHGLRREIPARRGMYFEVPHAADVPGSRFPGQFPGDNGPVTLGKIARGDIQGALDTVDNDAYLMQVLGFPPNMNALPFIGRSQLPVISYSLEALTRIYGEEVLIHYVEPLERYIGFWDAGTENLADIPLGRHGAYRRKVRMPNGAYTYRFYDDSPIDYKTMTGLRMEMMAADYERAERVLYGLEGEERERAFEYHQRSIMAACEGTQDFASKLFANYKDIETIRTLDIVPADLNANMAHLIRLVAMGYEAKGEYETAEKYYKKFNALAEAINTYMYRDLDSEHGMYGDVLLDGTPTDAINASMAYPLLTGGIVSYDRAIKTARTWKKQLLREYGFHTSTADWSEQQWDGEKIWPSLNLYLVEGFTQAAAEAVQKGQDPGLFLEVAEMARVGMISGVKEWYEEHRNIPENISGSNPRMHIAKGEYGEASKDGKGQKGFGMTIGSYRKLDGRDLRAEVFNPEISWRLLSLRRTVSGLILPGLIS